MPLSRPATVAGHHQDVVTPSMSPSSAVGRLHPPRPKSSASSHRPSSRATNRPPSSASTRPTSRTQHGPSSKFSQRMPSRHMSRVISLSHTLVSQVTGLQPEDEEDGFRDSVDLVIKRLEYNAKAAPSSSMHDIAKQLHGSVFLSHIPLATELGVVVSKGHGSTHRTLGLMPLSTLFLY
jgi:gamma-tubulin complex component 5